MCWSSLWCSDCLHQDLETRVSTSKHRACSLSFYFTTSKLHYYGNEAGISAGLKNSRKPWRTLLIFFFFLNMAVLEMTDAEILKTGKSCTCTFTTEECQSPGINILTCGFPSQKAKATKQGGAPS